MPAYVAIRFYKLGPDTDPADFERTFADVQPTLGLQRLFLLKRHAPSALELATSEYDYASIHFYTSPEEVARTRSRMADAQLEDELPAALQKLVAFWRAAHTDEAADSVVNGFTLVSETP